VAYSGRSQFQRTSEKSSGKVLTKFIGGVEFICEWLDWRDYCTNRSVLMSNSTTYGANSLAQNSSFFSIFFAFFKPICYALISTSRARLKLRWNQREKLYIGVYRELRRVCSKRAEISTTKKIFKSEFILNDFWMNELAIRRHVESIGVVISGFGSLARALYRRSWLRNFLFFSQVWAALIVVIRFQRFHF